MSSHGELELAPAYALGALDEAERAAFEAHLQGCRECQASVAAHAPVAGAIGYAAAAAPLPKGSGDRLVALYRAERASGLVPPAQPTSGSSAPAPRSGGVLVAAALGVVAVGLGFVAFENKRAFDSERTRAEALESSLLQSQESRRAGDEELRKTQAQLEHCRKHGDELTRLFSDPKLFMAFKPNAGFKGTAMAAFDPRTREVAVSTAALGPLPDGRMYKLWAFVKGKAAPMPMGAFDAKNALHMDHAPDGEVMGFAISDETVANATTTDHPDHVDLIPG